MQCDSLPSSIGLYPRELESYWYHHYEERALVSCKSHVLYRIVGRHDLCLGNDTNDIDAQLGSVVLCLLFFLAAACLQSDIPGCLSRGLIPNKRVCLMLCALHGWNVVDRNVGIDDAQTRSTLCRRIIPERP